MHPCRPTRYGIGSLFHAAALSLVACDAGTAPAQTVGPAREELAVATVHYLAPAATGALRYELDGRVVVPGERLCADDDNGLVYHLRRCVASSVLAVLCAGDDRVPRTIPAAAHLRRKGRDVSVVGLEEWLRDPPLQLWADQLDVALGLRVVVEHGEGAMASKVRISDDAPRVVRVDLDDLWTMLDAMVSPPERVPEAATPAPARRELPHDLAALPGWVTSWMSLRGRPASPFWEDLLVARRRVGTRAARGEWQRAGGSLPPWVAAEAAWHIDFPEEVAYELARLCGCWRIDHALLGWRAAPTPSWWAGADGVFDVARIVAELTASGATEVRGSWRCGEVGARITATRVELWSLPAPELAVTEPASRSWPIGAEHADLVAVVQAADVPFEPLELPSVHRHELTCVLGTPPTLTWRGTLGEGEDAAVLASGWDTRVRAGTRDVLDASLTGLYDLAGIVPLLQRGRFTAEGNTVLWRTEADWVRVLRAAWALGFR